MPANGQYTSWLLPLEGWVNAWINKIGLGRLTESRTVESKGAGTGVINAYEDIGGAWGRMAAAVPRRYHVLPMCVCYYLYLRVKLGADEAQDEASTGYGCQASGARLMCAEKLL